MLFSSSRSKALCYRLCSPHLPHLARVSKPKPTLMIFSRGSVKSLVRSAKRPELICGCFRERAVRDLLRLLHYRPSAFGAPVYRSMITFLNTYQGVCRCLASKLARVAQVPIMARQKYQRRLRKRQCECQCCAANPDHSIGKT